MQSQADLSAQLSQNPFLTKIGRASASARRTWRRDVPIAWAVAAILPPIIRRHAGTGARGAASGGQKPGKEELWSKKTAKPRGN